MSEQKVELIRLVRSFHTVARGDAKAQDRVKAVNTLLNSGHDLRILDDEDFERIWDSIFFAVWYAEMGRGAEEIIAAVERACHSSYRLNKKGIRTLANKWYGIDQHRLDKFCHLTRHLLSDLVRHQINWWIKDYRRSKELGTSDIESRSLLRDALVNVSKSHGLCYFMLESLSGEILRSTSSTYERLNIVVGKFEFKANLITFLYRQVISFASRVDLDTRLTRTFDRYIMLGLIQDIIPNEAQLTQILISLRLSQTLEDYINKTKSKKSRDLFSRWSPVFQQIHENCINCEYFPQTIYPSRTSLPYKQYLFNKNSIKTVNKYKKDR